MPRELSPENESSGVADWLGPEEAALQVINDLRLAIGTRLGVSEDRQEIDPESADAQAWAVYSWLSGMQEALVDAVAE